ncbi:MAG: hypothetical protein IJW73_04775 [Candidatus Gastranaerophilales bacterium]|nr:hypothetical protein [Candidatus Gastranaerophilales bacterium]
MQTSSTYKMLLLLNLLINEDCTKKEIIEKFNSLDVAITTPLITRYIDKFIKSDIKIKNKINDKRENVYYLDKNELSLDFSESEMRVISDIKKLLISQKNYDKIRKTMRLFYKLAQFVKDEEKQMLFLDFGYYSKINWYLVRQLEQHCKNKDIITLDYILPHGGNKIITIHADNLKISEWSQRLYLIGALFKSKHFSHLPVDRIFMIKKVEEEKAEFNVDLKNIYYTVSKTIYKKLPMDEKEQIVEEIGKDKIKIKRINDDEFSLIQRLFCYAPEIYNISDEKVKNMFKEKLEMLRVAYES